MVIWTPPACPSDKSRGDATTSSRGAYGASYIVLPLQRHRPRFFGRAGSAVGVDDQCSLPLLVLRTTCHSISIGCPDPAIRFSVGFHGRDWNGRCRDQRGWIHSGTRGGGGLGDGGDPARTGVLGLTETRDDAETEAAAST